MGPLEHCDADSYIYSMSLDNHIGPQARIIKENVAGIDLTITTQ
jgi:hypothetical protein